MYKILFLTLSLIILGFQYPAQAQNNEQDADNQWFWSDWTTTDEDQAPPEEGDFEYSDEIQWDEDLPPEEQIPEEPPVEVQPVETVEPPPPPAPPPVQQPQQAVAQPPLAPVAPPPVVTSFDAARQDCIASINRHRTTIGLPPLQRWTDGENCADNATRTDARSGIVHGSMGTCGDMAQNTCPNYDSINAVNTACLQAMWNEGPPPTEPCTGQCFADHGHYINMSNPNYTMVACGFYQTPDGKIWSNQNFR